ncbi:MAG TPA: [protein-PII] uridylyltransferase [Burkholderiaceae bacterium]|nr:[protein-PII] uridylyltransferase [Burkholderiaceae bacterium]
MNDPGFTLRAQLREQRARLVEAFRGGAPVERLLRGLSNTVDGCVRTAVKAVGLGDRVAVVAVGGYGRAELFPHSDVDVLIIPAREPDAADRAAIETLVGSLWDLGVTIGHAVRTIAECVDEARRDVTVMTAVLEARLVAGPRAVIEELDAAIRGVVDPQDFFRAKQLEQQFRHTKYQDAVYSLEPNCKESPGGLRDLQVLLWVSRAAGLGSSWREMHQSGLLTAAEIATIRRTERTLRTIRVWLHIVTGRREDRVVFDAQNEVATLLGVRPTAHRRASEVLMQAYYGAAKSATQVNTILLLNIEERLFPRPDIEPAPIDATFRAHHERLDLADADALDRDPSAILRAFPLLQQRTELKGMSARLLRAIWHGRGRIDAKFRADPANRELFLSVLKHPRGVVHTLRSMNQWSILGQYLPVFRRIVGQMQHDLFHVYTVDQHILMVVRNLRRFSLAEFAHEYPLCSQLISDFEGAWLLYLAAMFHDVAKGRSGDHSVLGARDVRRFAREHRLAPDDADLVTFLVQHHLTMSHVAQKQDLADPDVVTRFAQVVGTDRRLVALYLLTVADIRGTSPKVWNAWKARLLEDLFKLTRRALGGEGLPATAELESRKREALHVLKLYGLSAGAHEPLWRQLDIVYFMRNSAKDIAWHTRTLLVHVDTRHPIVRVRLAPAGEGIEVLLYTRDRPELFARACGFLGAHGLSILDAKIHTTRHGYALDTFLVTDHGRAGHFRELLQSIERDMPASIDDEGEMPAPTMGRLSRQSRQFPVLPAVRLQPDEGGTHSLLTIVATDRMGLLYTIARVLAANGINVHTARIITLGERVEDVFLIDGALLSTPKGQLKLESDLLQAIAT